MDPQWLESEESLETRRLQGLETEEWLSADPLRMVPGTQHPYQPEHVLRKSLIIKLRID